MVTNFCNKLKLFGTESTDNVYQAPIPFLTCGPLLSHEEPDKTKAQIMGNKFILGLVTPKNPLL